MEFRQLLPEPATVSVEDLLSAIEPRSSQVSDRPYTVVNFISSVDGRATFQGRSGALGDDGDQALFHGLRERADAVLMGTGTLRVERYGRLLGQAERRQRRVAAGRCPEPLACIVTRSGQLPLDIPLWSEPEAHILLFSAAEVELGGTRARVERVEVGPEPALPAVLRSLRADWGVELLLCEGGPRLFGSLLADRLVDELFLTLAPSLTGGGAGPTITTGPELPQLAELVTIWLLERDGAMYLRYGLRQ